MIENHTRHALCEERQRFVVRGWSALTSEKLKFRFFFPGLISNFSKAWPAHLHKP